MIKRLQAEDAEEDAEAGAGGGEGDVPAAPFTADNHSTSNNNTSINNNSDASTIDAETAALIRRMEAEEAGVMAGVEAADEDATAALIRELQNQVCY